MRSSNGLWGYRWASRAQAVLVFLSASVAAVIKAKPEQWGAKLGAVGPMVSGALKSIQENAWWLTPGMLALVGALNFVKRKIGEPEVWKELQRVVDDFHSDVYGAQTGQYHHHHRVTVYQYRRRWLYWKPGTWWLIPVVRSGHTSKSNVRKFRVHPNNPGCRNGLAGRAWESEGAIHVQQLPILSDQCSDSDFERYAEDTNISVKDLRKKRSSSRSYWAVKVRRKGGALGGSGVGLSVGDTEQEKGRWCIQPTRWCPFAVATEGLIMNEQVADWIPVDESKYNKIKRAHSGVDSRSVIIEMSLSPYDVPNQVRGDYDESSKKFVIDFKYIDSEDVKTVVLDDHMSTVVGKSSGRIYSLLIDIDAIGANSIELNIKEQKLHQDAEAALSQMLAEANSVASKAAMAKFNPKNYNVAQKIIKDYWEGISQEFLGAH